MTKFRIYFVLFIAFIAALAYAVLSMEFVQKKIFDVKSDITGSNRIVTFYSQIDATKVSSFEDKDMRYETKPSGAISIWLGSKSKKVESNLYYIIEDK